MSEYAVGMACLNGHAINGDVNGQPEFNASFCQKCGAESVTRCAECSQSLRGFYSGGYGFKWEPQAYCYHCGKPYPWTDRKAAALAATLDELDGINAADREKLKQSIPDILASTPMSGTAVLRFKKAVAAAGSVGGKILSDVLVKVAAEVVKQQLV